MTKRLTELISLCRTPKLQAADILPYFDRPATTEAIKGRFVIPHHPLNREPVIRPQLCPETFGISGSIMADTS